MHDSVRLLHERAMSSVRDYLRAESDLITILQEIDQCRGYREFGAKSLFEYSTRVLGLSDSVTLNLTSVARKAIEVPKLKAMIAERKITLSNARAIVPILTKENQEKWLRSAAALSKRDLERALAEAYPKKAVKEGTKPIAKGRLELKLGISEELHERLKRVRDLLSSQKKKPVNFEEALEVLTGFYLEYEDPLEQAKCIEEKNAKRAAKKQFKERCDNDVKKVINSDQLRRSDKESAEKLNEKSDGKKLARDLHVPGNAIEDAVAHTAKLSTKSLTETVSPTESADAKHLSSRSRVLSAALQRQIDLRDGTQCTETGLNGVRCEERRWLDYHHIKAFADGGKTTLENMTTLCRSHHQLRHHRSL